MFTAPTTIRRSLLAAAITGILSAGAAIPLAHAGGEGGAGGIDGVYASSRSPDGTVVTVRGHRDGSRTLTRTRNGKLLKKQVLRKKKLHRRPRNRQAMITMTNPDGTTVKVFRNADGSRTTERFDRNGNRIGRTTRRAPRPGTWRASGYNHSTGYGGVVVGNATGAFISVFGVGIGR